MKSTWGNRILWIFYLAIIGLFGYLNIYQKNISDILSANTFISIGMLTIVGGILFYTWKKYLRVSDAIIVDMDKVTKSIARKADSREDFLWGEYRENTTLFSEEGMQRAYDNYRQEMLRLEKNVAEGYKCDIEEFINYDLIDGVVNKGFLNLIPGVMTGLGILGTFVGLSFGLQQFNTGTAEEISASIAPLMDGIKVAFHTSIYGMVMSLVFNFVYKKKIERVYHSVDEFVIKWRRHVAPNAGNEGMNRLMEYQSKLTGDMSDMSEHAIDRMAEKLASILLPEYEKIHTVTGQILETTASFGQEVTKTLSDALVSEFAKLNETIADFAETTANVQVDGMGQMVNSFIEKLNEALSDRFTKLAQIIDASCDMQKVNTELLRETTEWISNTVKEIGAVNEESQKTVSCLQEYLEKLNALQQQINTDMALFEIQTKQNGELLIQTDQHNQALRDYIKQIVDVTDILEQKMASLEESTGKQLEKIIGMTLESGEQIKAQTVSIHEMGNKTVEGMEKSLESMSRSVREQMEKSLQATENYTSTLGTELRQQTAEIRESAVKQVDIMEKTAAGAVGSIERQAVAVTMGIEEEAENSAKSLIQMQKEVSDRSKEVASEMLSQVSSYTGSMQTYLQDFAMQLSKQLETCANTLSKEMQNATEKMRADIVESVKVVNKELADSLITIRELEKAVHSSNGENIERLNKRIEDFIVTMATTVKEQMNKIVEYKNQTNVDLNKATKQLYDAATKLDLGVQDNLERTFDLFDKNLATITMHLSGTIAEVDNTTKRVPAVVNASYEGMEKSLKQMEANMQTLVEELNSLVRQIENESEW